MFIVPLVVGYFKGYKEQVKFTFHILMLKRRDMKIKKVIKEFSFSINRLDKYVNANYLKRKYSTFSEFSKKTINKIKNENNKCKLNTTLCTNLFYEDNIYSYQLVVICYNTNGNFPKIDVINTTDSKIIKSSEINDMEEFKKFLDKDEGLWNTISSIEFKKKKSKKDNKGSSFKSKGGSFGGGGATGKW
jgi:uncharacterized membrane protein YgcG